MALAYSFYSQPHSLNNSVLFNFLADVFRTGRSKSAAVSVKIKNKRK